MLQKPKKKLTEEEKKEQAAKQPDSFPESLKPRVTKKILNLLKKKGPPTPKV